MTKLSVCARRKLKKARACHAGTRGTQQPGNVGMPKLEETLIGVANKPRPDGSNPTERVRPIKRPRNSRGPRTYKEALTLDSYLQGKQS
jgi:hypothetical protein